MDKRKIEKAVRIILEAVGEDTQREELRETPKRVADFYEVIFAELSRNLRSQLKLYSAKREGHLPTQTSACKGNFEKDRSLEKKPWL
jgi:GTP cyclohydrolase I